MKIPNVTTESVEQFFETVVQKIQEQGGKPEYLATFLHSPDRRYYDEAVNEIAQSAIWLAAQPESTSEGADDDSIVLEVDYNTTLLPAVIGCKHGCKVHTNDPKYFFDQQPNNCRRQEKIQFKSVRALRPRTFPVRIREAAYKEGLKACTGMHALAIKSLAEKDREFKEKIVDFMPMHFLGTIYTLVNGSTVQRCYLALDLEDDPHHLHFHKVDRKIVFHDTQARGVLYHGTAAFH